MPFINKPLEAIEESDLQNLVVERVREIKTIEYKQLLPGNSDGDKKEFLYDVSSFANAAGGDLIYGIKAEDGVASEVTGLQLANADAEILRLESIIRTGTEPRIPGLGIKHVSLQTNGGVLIIRVPRSFALPHMVKFSGASKFYSRNSAGKYPMDVPEIRAAFLLSETFAERARNFRLERLAQLVAGNSPVNLQDPPFAMLHLIPFGAFDPSARFDLSALVGKSDSLRPPPLEVGSFNAPRFNFDGLLTHSVSADSSPGYVQLFRNGIIEAVIADVKDTEREGRKLIPSSWLERQLIELLPTYFRAQREIGVEPPVFLLFSLVGVAGYVIGVNRRWHFSQVPIDRDMLPVAEVMIENFGGQPHTILRPIFDAVWNAAGWSRSMNYDEQGNWSQR